jgi:hypothetical protein
VRDFTLQAYRGLLSAITSNKIPVFGVAAWLQNKPQYGIMLRHDIDRKPLNALRVAELEHEFDIASTYYFRITKSSFDNDIVKKISNLGHEIGYHYEDLSLTNGNYDRAIELFKNHLEKIKALAPVKTIAMHGRPFSPHDNRDLWTRFNCKDFGLLAEAYLDVDYSNMYYITDTGRTWGRTKANIRDKVKSGLSADISSTESLIPFIADNKNKKIALVMHPERWARNGIDYCYSLSFDLSVNAIKAFIRILRNAG